jgi:GTPase SAR1 family protein
MLQLKFTRNLDIGSLEAEDDNFLISAFIEKQDSTVLQETDNQKCIIVGRTGTGKSALIRRLIEGEENVSQIRPEEMSLKYLSNSDILEYFRKLDVKLDLFYKVLWKHVFIVEILKLYYGPNKLTVEINYKEY